MLWAPRLLCFYALDFMLYVFYAIGVPTRSAIGSRLCFLFYGRHPLGRVLRLNLIHRIPDNTQVAQHTPQSLVIGRCTSAPPRPSPSGSLGPIEGCPSLAGRVLLAQRSPRAVWGSCLFAPACLCANAGLLNLRHTASPQAFSL
jgi:hypothetical protein